ncbi:hypothetical protein [Microcoleus phage My-WqHQDG]|nr:hypothetical protein [Microcoleus phage My-WqHQDG]
MSHNDNDCEPQRYTPIELGSSVLINALYRVDHHILDLEELVEKQQGRIQALRDEIYDYQYKERQAVYANVGHTLASILDNAGGRAPINEGMGIDTVLILKHLEHLIHRVTRGDDLSVDDFLEKVEQYVTDALERAAQVSKGILEGEENT